VAEAGDAPAPKFHDQEEMPQVEASVNVVELPTTIVVAFAVKSAFAAFTEI